MSETKTISWWNRYSYLFLTIGALFALVLIAYGLLQQPKMIGAMGGLVPFLFLSTVGGLVAGIITSIPIVGVWWMATR